jgi:dimethylglycine dehydrogenase
MATLILLVQQNAMAKGARNGGAKIYRKNRVTDIKKTSSGEWKVITEKRRYNL